MANTVIGFYRSKKCFKCNATMQLELGGALGLWVCFKCKQFKKEYNGLGKIIDKFLSIFKR